MQQIRSGIKQSDENLILPIPEKNWQLSEIAKFSQVDMVSSQGLLIVYIHLPLVDHVTYRLYRMLPLIVPQLINPEIKGQSMSTPQIGTWTSAKISCNILKWTRKIQRNVCACPMGICAIQREEYDKLPVPQTAKLLCF